MIFVIITLVGVSYVGARYARLDRLVRDDAYTVVAHFEKSGGIFTKAEVTYRGVNIGEVERLVLTDDGVDVHLGIENQWDRIPSDTFALVGNKSAVGEQYVELQPKSDPDETDDYLVEDSEIAMGDTDTPLETDTLLTNLSTTVGSVDLPALQTTVSELGAAFAGTGENLQRLIDSGNSFIEAANDNFDTTTTLIRDGNTVLNGQVASESALRTFARDLSRFSSALAGADGDLRKVIDSGSFTANQLRSFIEANRVELGGLIRNLTTTGEVIVKRLPGIKQVLVIYPYVVEGGFTVVSKTPQTGLYDAHFGMIITDSKPCYRGYIPIEDRRTPNERNDIPMAEDARCSEPPTESNPRGEQNIPRRAPAAYDASPVVASYDPTTAQVTWGAPEGSLTRTGSVAPSSLGEESWKWLYLQPLMAQ